MEVILTGNSGYFERLKWLIDAEGYEKLIDVMYKTDFWSDNDLDQNLIDNTIDYRWSNGYVGTDKVSVFEVLVVLCVDIERKIMHATGAGDRTPEWFWVIMRNLKLDRYSDERWNRRSEGEIMKILDNFLSRNYTKRGEGGPFPIKSGGKDCQKADLWRQMNWYLDENFRYEFKIEVI